ncbi:hypothetical protein [Ferruginibacter sp.]|uniref:hypothetical protein n=1 Tax=Ferruginibacter sp. TaxID=1940288 RepID=UPI00265B3822|nr:hypothetical protein [Ferruginibacter sp.]
MASKFSIIISQGTRIIMRTINFTQTLYYSRIIAGLAEQLERRDGSQAKDAFVYRGYGKK